MLWNGKKLPVQRHSNIAFLAGMGAKALVIQRLSFVFKHFAALQASPFNRIIPQVL